MQVMKLLYTVNYISSGPGGIKMAVFCESDSTVTDILQHKTFPDWQLLDCGAKVTVWACGLCGETTRRLSRRNVTFSA